MSNENEKKYNESLEKTATLKMSVRIDCALERARIGRAIDQEVSRQLPAAAARVRAQVRSCEVCGAQSVTRAGFLRVRRFPLPILIPPTTLHSSSIIRDWYSRPISG
jgi:hypothetical protein